MQDYGSTCWYDGTTTGTTSTAAGRYGTVVLQQIVTST